MFIMPRSKNLLLEEWADADKRQVDFLLASHVKVPWKCGECGWGW